MDKVGPEAVVKLTHKLGMKSEIPIQPSIALGAVDITVEDMVRHTVHLQIKVFIQNLSFGRRQKWRHYL
jgi:hypothetical protein